MELSLKYNKPAENSDTGWEEYSIPVGNGYMGANIFGGISRERIQITENSMVNPGEGEPTAGRMGGLTSFAEIFIDFPHQNVHNYERGLHLNQAVAYTKYEFNSIRYKREYFASYPDKVLVIKLTSSVNGGLSFKLCPQIPFIKDYSIEENDGGGKTGKVEVCDNTIYLKGKLKYYSVFFEGQIKVVADGTIAEGEDYISVSNASEAIIIVAVGTNYKLASEVFTTTDITLKAIGEDPHKKVSEYLKDACKLSYDELKKRHTEDFSGFFNRVSFDLGECSDKYTDELLEEYKSGNRSKYLEALYFQYGRYLLISSSRKGGLPANLQGIWNCHEHSPWGSGYWHNINVQMNYWPAFNTNLVEMFESYADYFMAYYHAATKLADSYIKEKNPENYEEGECGFTIGTAAFPYYITAPGKHSGPGTGAMTSKLFWEYYDFTRDEEILKNVSYKALKGMSEFLTKTVKEYDGEYLTAFSASPEQMHNGRYTRNGKYYHTVGCTFDQQMIYENGKDFIKASEILNENNKALEVQKNQIDKYHPVRIGWSGQIKEFMEENFYGEIGEYNHRHISQLMALYPGTLINSDTDAWMSAAKYTLTERGDDSTGWALAHRLNAWARTGDGNHAYTLLKELITSKTNPNLWNEHPPFQIDGNFGATAGIAEMLLQSHEGYVHILPSLPDFWDKGEVKGLTARGNFVVDVAWENSTAKMVKIKSGKGNLVRIKADFGKNISVVGNEKQIEISIKNGILEFASTKDSVYEIKGFVKKERKTKTLAFDVTKDLELSWNGEKCDIYRAVDDEPVFKLIAQNAQSPYKDDLDFDSADVVTYKLSNSNGEAVKTINHATKLDYDRYRNIINSKR